MNSETGTLKFSKSGLYLALLIIPFGSNTIVVIFTNFILTRIFSGKNLNALLGIPDNLLPLFNILPFLFALIVFVFYTFDIFRTFYSAIPDWNSTVIRKLVNMPIVSASISFLAWLVPVVELFVLIIFMKTSFQWLYLISFVVISMLTAVLAFMICYYGVDSIVSRLYVQRLNQIIPLASIPKIYFISIRAKFFIFMISAAIAPVVLTSFSLFIAQNRLIELGYDGDRLLPILLLVVFSFTTFFLTRLITRDFHEPLARLEQGTNDISQGNFDVKLPLYKIDEIGKITDRFNHMSENLKEKEFIKDTLGKVVDPGVRDYMLSGKVKLGGEMREATVLFSDIRSFTTLSENLNPEQVVNLLNRYFERMSRCITLNGGIVNKYIGDAIMALFGAPLELQGHAPCAFAAAEAMLAARDELNRALIEEGFPAIKTGIGIHTGSLLSGNIGSNDRLEYTVIGDTVNIASRIESLCKKVSSDFLISSDTYDQLSDEQKQICEARGRVKVKGKENLIKIYSVHPEHR